MNVNQWCGHTVLHIGPGSGVSSWGPGNMARAARVARGLGVDTISPKRAEGTVKWYQNPAQLKAERQAALDQGCGFIPHYYSDGPKFGLPFVIQEAEVMLEMLEACGSICLDMEAEWDGQVEAAQALARALASRQGYIFVNPWANPDQHAWGGVAHALATIADAWIPQQYTDWLAAQEATQEVKDYGHNLMPELDLTQEFGVNHQTAIATQAAHNGHATIWLWEYTPATKNPDLVHQLVNIIEHTPAAPKSPPAAPTPTKPRTYTVAPGDTLSGIAEHFGVSLEALEKLEDNRIAVASAQVAHGVGNFNWDDIWPGTVLVIP